MMPSESMPSKIEKPPESITLWTIYHNPIDLPPGYYMRPQFSAKKMPGVDLTKFGRIELDLGTAAVVISRLVWGAKTLEELHSILPPNVTQIGPGPGDQPHIIEVWME